MTNFRESTLILQAFIVRNLQIGQKLRLLYVINVLVRCSQELNIHFIVSLLFRGTMNITAKYEVE